ncbi:uncharacterized protein LOC116337680 [Contarinia nasturtii]|uniref:uncharacterized protein LOC116337680 n=1 Tax=Contarinia nasturtii TaxID=265458 RepID=UPI0012D40698|nr:uncharacterized protein LOC116337680 [Contarinia nasturtii]
MAKKWETSLALSMMVLFALISCCMTQTFQYSRGWVNGKRSGPPNAPKAEEIPDICKQFFLSEILAHSNPLTVHIIAHDYATNPHQFHSAASYQRPQIKHESDLVPAAPYIIESSSPNAYDPNDRYKRNAKKNI